MLIYRFIKLANSLFSSAKDSVTGSFKLISNSLIDDCITG